MLNKLYLRDFVPDGKWYHLARTTFSGRQPERMHCHDFSEIFWVTQGEGIHLCNGIRIPLSQGHLVVVRPEDSHAFLTLRGKSWTIANLAFASGVMEDLIARYPDAASQLVSSSIQLSPAQLVKLDQQVRELHGVSQSQLVLDRFLCNLLFILSLEPSAAETSHLPVWLSSALRELQRQDAFQYGLEAFVKLCGRTQEHVTRECSRHLGQTPTETVNDVRLRYAESQLLSTDKSVKEICWECGFKSAAYFHRLFRERYGSSPKAFKEERCAIFHQSLQRSCGIGLLCDAPLVRDK